jgi:predicted  nucleic acid-binding Zn-ribbon protein
MAKVTIDNLAAMMQKEFFSLHGEIQSIRTDIRRLEILLNEIKERLEKLKNALLKMMKLWSRK